MADVTDDDIIQLSNKYGLPPEIGLSIYQQESGSGRNTKTSAAGAVGGFQVTPIAARDVGMDPGDLKDPYSNAEAGIKYLSKAYKATGTVEGTAAYYHAGPAFARKIALNPELSDGGIKTTDYVTQVAQRAAALKDTVVQKVKTAFTPTPKGNTMAGGASGDFSLDDMLADASSSGATSDFGPSDAPATAPVTPSPIPAGTVIPEGTVNVSPSPSDKISAVMDQAGDVVKQMLASSDALTRQTQENLRAQADGLRKEGDLAATASLEKFRVENSRAAENAAELSRLGINASDPNSLIADISTRLKDNYLSAREQRENIYARQNTGILDDPMGYIINQLGLPGIIREHNQTVATIKQDEDYLAEASAVAQHSDAVTSAKYSSTTAVGAAAAADLLRTKANDNALKISEQLLKTDFDSQIRKMTALEGQARIYSTLEDQSQKREIQRTKQQADQDKADQQAIIDQKVALAGRMIGYPGVTSFKELLKQPKGIREAIQKVADSGGGQIATTPYDADELLKIANKDQMPGAVKTTAAMLRTFRQTAEAEAQRMVNSTQITDLKKVPGFVNQKMQDSILALQKNPSQQVYFTSMNGGQNPFHIPDPDNMAKDGGAASIKLTRILQEQKKILPQNAWNDSLIPQLAFAQIGKPDGYKDISEAAKDISDYFKQGIAINNRTYHFEQWGIQPQNAYPVETRTGGGITGMNKVRDLSNYPDAVKAMLDLRSDQEFQTYSTNLSFGG